MKYEANTFYMTESLSLNIGVFYYLLKVYNNNFKKYKETKCTITTELLIQILIFHVL